MSARPEAAPTLSCGASTCPLPRVSHSRIHSPPVLGLTGILATGVVFLAALVKGAIGFGFPTVGTPLLSLVVDVKTAVVVLIIPNIVMDALQFARRGAPIAIVRRFALLLVFGAAGAMFGTRVLIALSPKAATLVLGSFIVVFVALRVGGFAPKVDPRWEPGTSPVAGAVTGIVGGITNVPGTPLVMYFHALGLSKGDFVSSVSFTFVVYKVVQLAAVAYYGLLTPSRIGFSLVL